MQAYIKTGSSISNPLDLSPFIALKSYVMFMPRQTTTTSFCIPDSSPMFMLALLNQLTFISHCSLQSSPGWKRSAGERSKAGFEMDIST